MAGKFLWKLHYDNTNINTGVTGRSVTLLVTDRAIVNESFLEDISGILSSGEIPDLYDTYPFMCLQFFWLYLIFVARSMNKLSIKCYLWQQQQELKPTKLVCSDTSSKWLGVGCTYYCV